MFVIVALKVFKYLEYFCSRICSLELSEIAQSDHTDSLRIWLKVFCTLSRQNLGSHLELITIYLCAEAKPTSKYYFVLALVAVAIAELTEW